MMHSILAQHSPSVDLEQSAPQSDLWRGIDRLIDRAQSLEAIRAHGLGAIALARWRDLGHPIPPVLLEEAQAATLNALATPLLLKRIRSACDGPIIVLKGPEAAACYPSPALRPYGDLDLLVPDAPAVQRALVAAGFVPVGDERLYRDIHHLQPLQLDGLPLVVEIHSRPKWPAGLAPPPVEAFFADAVDAAVPVEGVLALPRAQHALVLAAHSWAHVPLGRLFNVIDVAVVRDGAAPEELDSLAAEWGLKRMWRLTAATIDALLFDGRHPWPLHVWARELVDVRERSVLANHLQRWLAGFSALRPDAAAVAAARAIVQDVRRKPDESWSTKLKRTRLALTNATAARSEHEAAVENALATRQDPEREE
jgi:hypothetical protein